jgi:hypothetical protein
MVCGHEFLFYEFLSHSNVTHTLAQVCIGYPTIFLFQNHFLVIDRIANDEILKMQYLLLL